MFAVRQAAGRPTRHREILQFDLPFAGATLKDQPQVIEHLRQQLLTH
jgi:hypothetical protein